MLKQQEKKTALYCRLSREDLHGGNNDSSSIQTQKTMLSKFAEDNNLLNREFYVDDGASGVSFDREDFQRMISDIEDGKVSCVVTKDLSRLGRNYLEAGRYRELFSEYGVRYIAMSDGYDSVNDDGGDIATPIKEIIHEFYARDCSRKIRSSIKTKAHSEGLVWGIAPYGYHRTKEKANRLEPNPEIVPIVQRMFRLALEGKSCFQISQILRKDEILIPRAYHQSKGKGYGYTVKYPYDWSITTVRNILSNPVYTGKLVNLRQTNKSFKDSRRVARPESEWAITENVHEPLVSQQDFDTVQERIKVKQRTGEIASEENIFRGLVVCSDCGKKMSFNRKKKQDANFRCQVSIRMGKSACTTHYISLEKLKTVILNDIKCNASLAADNAKAYAEHLLKISESEQVSKNHSLKKEADKCDRRLFEIDTLIQQLYEDKVFGVITQERFVSMTAKLETEQKTLKERYAELTEYLNRSDEKSRNADSFAELIQNYTDITELDSELVHTLIEKIVVHETEEIDGEKCKRIDVFYRFIGNLNGQSELIYVVPKNQFAA